MEADPEHAVPDSQQVSRWDVARNEAEEVRSTTPGTRAVFTSMLDPPFLFTVSGASQHSDDSEGRDQAPDTTAQRSMSPSMRRSQSASRREDLIITLDQADNPAVPPGIETHASNLNVNKCEDPEKLSLGPQSPMSPISPQSLDSTKKFGSL